MDQRWVLALPILAGIWFIGAALAMYGRTGERFLKGSALLRAYGPGVVTAPFGLGLSCLLVPVAYAVWSVVWARNVAMIMLLTSFTGGILSFAWSPRQLLPKWLRPLVRTPSWVVALGSLVRRR